MNFGQLPQLARRCAMFGGALTLAFTLATPYPVEAQEMRKLRIATIPIVDYAGLWICMERGFCEQAGIQLEFRTLGGGATIIAAIKGGSLDLGAVGIVPALRARAQGLDLKFVALASAESNNQDGGPQDVILVKNPALKTGKDFVLETPALTRIHLKQLPFLRPQPGIYEKLERARSKLFEPTHRGV